MRKVTELTCSAFVDRVKYTNGNTHTDGTTLYLHGNAIAQWRDDGLYITHAGWPTNTTKERLNGLSGVRISQNRGEWYLNGHKWSGKWAKVDGFTGDVTESDTKKDRDMLKRIKSYSDLYLDKDIYPLLPSAGDCWYCALRTSESKPLGDATDNHAHLIEHMKDKYLMGSLVVNALRDSGWQDFQIGIQLHGFSPDNVRRAVYRYFKKRLTKLAR